MPREISMQRNGAPFLERAEIATTMRDRMRGLLGRSSLLPRNGLLILPCPSIHMLGMKFPIDAIFLDRAGRVVRIVRNIQPWTFMVSGGRGAHATLEIAAGWLAEDALRVGDVLSWA